MLSFDLNILAAWPPWSMQMNPGWWWLWLTVAAIPLLLSPALFWRGRRMAYLSILCSMLALWLGYLWLNNAREKSSFGVEFPIISKAKTEIIGITFSSGGGGIGINMRVMLIANPLPNEITRSFANGPIVGLTTGYSIPGQPEKIYPSAGRGWLGFGWTSKNLTSPGGTRHILWAMCLPNWFGITCVGWVPIFWLARRPARRRNFARKRGLCERCLFDLRGTPESPDGSRRCGECGHINLKSASIAAPKKPESEATQAHTEQT